MKYMEANDMNAIKIWLIAIVVFVIYILCASYSDAELVRHGNFEGDLKVIEFSDFKYDKYFPAMVGSYGDHIRATTSGVFGAIIYEGVTLGENNGAWNADVDGYVIADRNVTFRFSQPVAAVGAFINYLAVVNTPASIQVSVLNRNGVLLESHMVNIETPDKVNSGKFVGIRRGAADIYKFKVSMIHNTIVLDNLTYSTVITPMIRYDVIKKSQRSVEPIPEPATLFLMGTGLACMLLYNRKVN